MRVLVCGGRTLGLSIDTSQRHPVCHIKAEEAYQIGYVLTAFRHKNPMFNLLIEGCAPGADTVCGLWAAFNGVQLRQVPAEWRVFDSKAGPLRNKKMLDTYAPNVLIAFNGGIGTNDMITRAEKAGVRVIDASGDIVEIPACS